MYVWILKEINQKRQAQENHIFIIQVYKYSQEFKQTKYSVKFNQLQTSPTLNATQSSVN